MTTVPRQQFELNVRDLALSIGEQRQVQEAVAMASSHGIATVVVFEGGTAAILPPGALEVWEAYMAGVCTACSAGRHADCPRHYRGTEHLPCNCDNRSVHSAITADQVALARIARRR